MNRTEFAHEKFFYNFYSLHFSVRRDLMIASPSEKVPEFPYGAKLKALTVVLYGIAHNVRDSSELRG
jgi:hypothetical protein